MAEKQLTAEAEEAPEQPRFVKDETVPGNQYWDRDVGGIIACRPGQTPEEVLAEVEADALAERDNSPPEPEPLTRAEKLDRMLASAGLTAEDFAAELDQRKAVRP